MTSPPDLDAELEALWRGSNLTAAQALVWLHQHRHPRLPTQHTAVLWTLPAEIDPARFEAAVQHVVNGCDAIRTVIEEQAGIPQQRVASEVSVTLEVVDVSDAADPADAARKWAVQRAQTPFQFDQRLFDAALLRLGGHRFAWFLNQHKIIADGWSALLIFRRVAEAYRAALDGTTEASPAAPLFADYVAAERPFANSPKFPKTRHYWQTKFAAIPSPLSFADSGNTVGATQRAHVTRSIGAARSQRLREITAGPDFAGAFQNLGMFSLFTGLLLTCLFHRTGQPRIALGTPASARASRKLEDTAGLCTHMVVEYFEITPDESLLALTRKVRSEMVEVLRQQSFVVSTLPPRRLYDAVINFCHGKAGTFLGSPVETEFIDHGFQDDSQEKLAFQVRDYDAAGEFVLDFDFRCDTFDAARQQEFIRHFFGVLDAFLEDNERPVRDICPTPPPAISDWKPATPSPGSLDRPATPVPVAAPARRAFVAPRSPIEERLAQHWKEALGVEKVGVDDNFFELGGSSLLAVGLFARIEEEFGPNLPISALLQHPTIAQLAGLIEQGDTGSHWPSLVLMQPGTAPALFCVHGVRGDILRFRDMVRRLDPQRAIYGLRARGLDGQQAPQKTVEEMASSYAAEILGAQPQGPFFLLGYSFGGLVAYEIGRQLSAQGHEVGLVALIDTRRDLTPRLQLLNLLCLPFAQKLKRVRTMIQAKLEEQRLGLNGVPATLAAGQDTASRPMRIDQVRKTSQRAAAQYVPQPCEVHVTLFQANDQLAPRVRRIINYPWENLALRGFDLVELPCEHAAIVMEPDVRHLTERLEARLARASAAPGRVSAGASPT